MQGIEPLNWKLLAWLGTTWTSKPVVNHLEVINAPSVHQKNIKNHLEVINAPSAHQKNINAPWATY